MLDKMLMFGAGGKRTIDLTTPVPIVNSAYTTSASARPQVLSNGWIVSCAHNGSTGAAASKIVYFYVSKDNGTTWQQLCYTTYATTIGGLTTDGINIYYASNIYADFALIKFNATTVTNIDLYSTRVVILADDGYGFNSGGSIAYNNGNLTACWSSKRVAYPNSWNIQSAKSTNLGVTWTKQDGTAGVDQIYNSNTTGYDLIEPCVIYMTNGKPFIVCSYKAGGASTVALWSFYFTTVWSSFTWLYNGATYTQSSPSATVQRYGANVGRIWVTWHGVDSVDNGYFNIRCKYSDDNGITWVNGGVSAEKITTGNTKFQQYPSITTDKNGDVFILWEGADSTSYRGIRKIKRTSGIWGSIINIAYPSGSYNNVYPSTCDNYYDFDQPITIWQDNQDTGDKALLHFNGTNGSTTFTDESGKVWTTGAGSPSIATSQSKFGGSALFLNGSASIYTTDSDEFNIAKNATTIDFWFKRTRTGVEEVLFEQRPVGGAISNSSFYIRITNTDYVDVCIYNTSSGYNLINTNIQIIDTNWHHVALVFTGTILYTAVDGNVVQTNANITVNNSTSSLQIGYSNVLGSYFNGYIDEFRFTKGVARWTSNFTPPISEAVYSNNPPSVDVYGKYYV